MLNNIPQKTHLLLLLFLSLLVNISSAEPVGHNLCKDCHLTAKPTSDNNDLLKPVTELCIECHKKGKRNDHAIGIPPGVDGTNGLPLVAGKIECITCHNMHVKTRMLLRLNTEGLCLACHPKH